MKLRKSQLTRKISKLQSALDASEKKNQELVKKQAELENAQREIAAKQEEIENWRKHLVTILNASKNWKRNCFACGSPGWCF